mmetsp:Transcript_24339/g.52481  ORF Transcript_24339/g.52481 Transcript_24339/m.52481 type:complete len:221 (-) Transcript_24339:1765-2427(-)
MKINGTPLRAATTLAFLGTPNCLACSFRHDSQSFKFILILQLVLILLHQITSKHAPFLTQRTHNKSRIVSKSNRPPSPHQSGSFVKSNIHQMVSRGGSVFAEGDYAHVVPAEDATGLGERGGGRCECWLEWDAGSVIVSVVGVIIGGGIVGIDWIVVGVEHVVCIVFGIVVDIVTGSCLLVVVICVGLAWSLNEIIILNLIVIIAVIGLIINKLGSILLI